MVPLLLFRNNSLCHLGYDQCQYAKAIQTYSSVLMFLCLQASSTYAVTAAPVDPFPRARSSMANIYPPMANSYGSYSVTVPGSAATFSTGVHTAGITMQQKAPSSVQRFQSPTGNQHEFHSGYPSAPDQYRMPSSYPSNPKSQTNISYMEATKVPHLLVMDRANMDPIGTRAHTILILITLRCTNVFRLP